ncbi:MAG: DUF262 domain-containing protein [Sandaracinaceae bacterium]|nr:DUF262 domain-containing protein [Sandaracinaceae bacterium]
MATFDSTKTRLATVLDDIMSGKIQLPDFQRGWVWDDEHIRSLLVSIARAFPIGAVMLLETGGDARFKVRPVEGVTGLHPATSADLAEKLILDGQQRLTSLTQVLKMHTPVLTKDPKKRVLRRHYYIDIDMALSGPEHYDEAVIGVDEERTLRTNFGRDITLDLSSSEKEYANLHFPCDQILNSDAWEQGLHEHRPDRFGAYMTFRKTVLEQFRSYDVPVIELKKDNTKEAVCLVFEKVNTGGVQLSVFELVTATYAADGVNLRDEWYGNASDGIEGIGPRLHHQPLLRDVQPTDFLQGLSLLHTYARRRADLADGKTGKQVTGVSAKRESVLGLPLSAYKSLREPLFRGFWLAAKFLRKESFFSRRDTPYRTQLVPLACILTLLEDRWLEPKAYDRLARWFWSGVLGELYGGAVETRMGNDLQEVMAWIDGSEVEPGTVRDANFQPARLDTLRSRNSAAYKGIHVLIQRNGAKDWFWKTTIRELDETDWEECKLDIHHVFPKDWCQKRGIPPKRFDSILNKTPISYKANRMIGGRAPSAYLEQLAAHAQVQLDSAAMDALLATHFLDPGFLRSDDYDGFIEARRRTLLAEISRVMGKPLVASEEPGVDDGDEDDSGENDDVVD